MNCLYENAYPLINNILKTRYNDLEQEIILCESLLQFSTEQGYDYGVAFAYTYLGDAYLGLDQISDALRMLNQARTYSERHGFQDLLMKAHHFTGSCYLMMHDEHSATDHYLISLELAYALDDVTDQSIILNNIATVYDKRHATQDAAYYYQAAYQLLSEQTFETNTTYSCVLLYNLIHTACQLGNLNDARSYLLTIKNLPHPSDTMQFVSLCAQHIYAIASGNKQTALELCRQILLLMPDKLPDKYFTFEILSPVFEDMLELKHQDFSHQILELLKALCGQNEPDHQKTLMRYNVQYCKFFDTKEMLYQAYQDFFNTMSDNDQLNNQLITSGIKARIHVTQLTKEKERVQRLNKDLERAANLDETTRLYNRRYFNQIIERLRRDNSAQSAGVILLDIDYFKEYNDCYGHIEGDRILLTIADCLTSCAPTNVYPCRHGGDEFACLCLNMDDSGIEEYLNNVQNKLAAYHIPHQDSACSSIVSLSAGYCNTAYSQDTNLQCILSTADEALYQAKAKGRNQFFKKDMLT